jgi:hypothetical protein
VSRRPERLVGVHGAAVADERDHGPAGLRQLDAARRGQARPDAAAADPVERLGSLERSSSRTPWPEEMLSSTTTMTKHYPSWREARAELNDLPLTAESWRV